jgi:Bacterial PH domain
LNRPNSLSPSNRPFRVIAWLLGILIIAVGVAVSLSGASPWWAPVPVLLVCAVGVWLCWKVYGLPQLIADTTSITVVNPFKTYRIPLAGVASVEAGRYLTLHLLSGESIRVWCVQAANISLMLKRESHVDRVASELREWIACYGRNQPSTKDDPAPMPSPSPDLARSAWVFAILVVIVTVIRIFVGS